MAGRFDPLQRNAVIDSNQFCLAVPLRQSRLETPVGGISRASAPSWGVASDRNIYLNAYTKSNHRWRGNLRDLLAALGTRVGERLRFGNVRTRPGIPLGAYAFRIFRKRPAVHQRLRVLLECHSSGALSYRPFDGILALEILNEHAVAARPANQVSVVSLCVCTHLRDHSAGRKCLGGPL